MPRGRTKPHTQHTHNSGRPRTFGLPQPPFPSPGVGGMPQLPPTPPAFLPATPGFEAARRSANDQLTGAEGQYAMGQIMTPAQLGLENQRLTTDMGFATNRLNEDLANRGVYTAKNAAGTYGNVSPAGGGIGQSLYTEHVATPFGRQFQDLASQGAQSYGDLASNMAGAQLGYNQNLFTGLLGAGQEAFQAQPLSLPIGGYNVPNMANPSFTSPPQGRPGLGRPGRTQPRHHRRGGK